MKLLSLLALFIGFTSCSDNNDDSPTLLNVETETFTNLFAPQEGGIDPVTGQPLPVSGEFTKFDFATGQTTTSEAEWDIAFRGTTIVINGGTSFGATDEPERTGNGGVYIADGTFASIEAVVTDNLEQDSESGYAIVTGSGNGWYTYNPVNNSISPTPGKVIVIRTRDGKYAKMEILSYYKDAPEEITADIAANDARYYTFNYIYQPNEGLTTFE